ncbi:MAG: potassium channel family protein [bacterium]
MFIVIAGGGKTGAHLAHILLNQEQEVLLIEYRNELLPRLHRELPTEVIFEGRADDPLTLDAAGLSRAQAIIACTSEDEVNLLVCYLARSRYHVPRTVARVNDPRHAWLFDKKFHVDVAVNESEILASVIEEDIALGDMMTLLKLHQGPYFLVSEKIQKGSPASGKAIKELGIPKRCVIAAIIRKGELILPKGDTLFEEGDEVLAIVDEEGSKRFEKLLSPSKT